MKRFSLLMSLLALTACGGTNGSPTGTPPGAEDSSFAAHNSAVLSGEPLGTGVTDLSELRKEVPVTLTAPADGLELAATAYVTRQSASSTTPYWFFTVRNTGEAKCFVRIGTIQMLDAGGAVLAEEDFSFVYGSVKQTLSDTWTDTCLEQNQSAYVIGLDTNVDFADISGFRIGGFDEPLTDVSDVPASLKPQSYRTTASDGSAFSLAVQNQGAQTGVFSLAAYILLDDQDAPLTWGFVTDAANEVPMDAGEARFFGETVRYEGSAEAMFVTVDFDSPNETLLANHLTQLSLGDLLQQRDVSEQAKLEALRSQ